jgi:hypothetical protein
MKRLLTFLLVVSLTVPDGRAQSDTTTVFQIDSLPLTPQGVLLDKGWKWHAGDKPDWARADFDDSKWENIDPSKDIMYLPQVRKAGIGWLRLNLHVDNSILQKKAPATALRQASLIRNRLKTLDETAWDMIAHREQEVAIQLLLVAAIRHSQL